VKLRGCERELLDQFRVHTEGSARMATRQSLAEQVPRLWFELLAVVALFILAAAMVWEGRPMRALVPMLGLFATVAFRVLPSVTYAAVGFQRLRQYEPMLESLREYLADEESVALSAATRSRSFHDAIRLEKVSYRYPTGHEAVLHDVDIEIPHGMAVGIIGGSGAGKSTLVDVILGLLSPSSGRVLVDGIDIHDNLRGWQRLIGYVPQSIFLCDDTIRRNIAFGVPEKEIDDAAVRRAVTAAQLDEFVAGLPDGVQTRVGERGVRFSGGQRQRIGIARALYHDPEVLVLDEATSALDIDTEREVMAAVDSLHGVKTLIIVAHRLTTVANCDVLHRLDAGRVVQSGPFSAVVTG
jgi:ATP-binding cassette, subfamily B, bacterial PglK